MPIEVPPGRFVDLDGPVHFVEWEGPPGRTFVLVHGLGGSLLSWIAVAPGLARHGRVLALDLPGFGRTARDGRRSRVSDLRSTVSGFIDEVAQGPVVLVGNSMGGGIAMLEAALEPKAVHALVLSNSVFPWKRGAFPAPIVMLGFALYEMPRVGEWASRQRLTRLEADRAVRLGLRIITADPASVSEDLVRLHVEQLVGLQGEADAGPAFLEAARSLLALGRRREVVRWLVNAVSCPVLVIHGREDRLVPLGFAMGALEMRPEWEMRLIPKVGHVPQMEAPERWLAAVEDWLAGVPLPA
ncbi:MAG TPA: alpha/beta fold hydrolase [Actinomycetota bacterium]|nr:alpha/beta fold hydrolase [Actinomycetota bacterium]